MILSAGMPILAEETEVQEPVVEQTETILGWNETHDMYTKEDGTFALGWQEIDQEMYYFNEQGILQCDQWIDNHYVGLDGKTMCVDTFGASAPASRVIKEYGFTVENVVKEYNSL